MFVLVVLRPRGLMVKAPVFGSNTLEIGVRSRTLPFFEKILIYIAFESPRGRSYFLGSVIDG